MKLNHNITFIALFAAAAATACGGSVDGEFVDGEFLDGESGATTSADEDFVEKAATQGVFENNHTYWISGCDITPDLATTSYSLGVLGASTANNAAVVLWDSGSATNKPVDHQWTAEATSNGYFRLRNRKSGKYMIVGNKNGSRVLQRSGGVQTAMEFKSSRITGRWQINNGNSTNRDCTKITRKSGGVLDVPRFDYKQKAGIQNWRDLNTSSGYVASRFNQRWIITEVPLAQIL